MKNQFNSFIELKKHNNSKSFDKDIEDERYKECEKMKKELEKTKRKPTPSEKIIDRLKENDCRLKDINDGINDDDEWLMPRKYKHNDTILKKWLEKLINRK
ncbi:MAG: hypothetical protein ACOC3Z_02080 [Nanoarchaeota archaeon]